MKILYTLLASLLFSTAALAEQVFFSAPNLRGNWQVIGTSGDQTLNPACKLIMTWRDGSSFELIKDLADGELYILLINNTWSINDPPNTLAKARLNFYTGNTISGGPATFELLNKNTIRFRGLVADRFLPDFVSAQKLVIVMPGTVSNAEVNLEGTRNGIDVLSNCVRTYVPSNRTVKPGINL